MTKAGTLGFGVGLCPEYISKLGMEPLPGCDDIENDNYGNYIHKPSSSIMCWIPAFKYRVNDKFVNSVEVWDVNDPDCPSNAILHRAFINGGRKKSGFFCDKYICSPDANNTMGISVKNGSTLSLTTSASYGNHTSQLANCIGRFEDAITASRAHGNSFQCMSVFQLGALRMLMLAHGQASTSTEFNEWYDPAGIHNLPKGAARGPAIDQNTKQDEDRPNGIYYFGLTGSCTIPSECAHNGQNSGILDLKGYVYQCIVGCSGLSQTSLMFVKQEVDITSLDKDSLYFESNLSPLSYTYRSCFHPDYQAFNNDITGINYYACGFINTVTSSPYGYEGPDGMFENDYICEIGSYSGFPIQSFGNRWTSSFAHKEFGLFGFDYGSRSNNASNVGFRACCYV